MFIKTSRKTGGRILTSKDLVDEFVAKELSRRQMAKAVLAASAAAWLGGSALGCTTTTTVQGSNGSSGDPGSSGNPGQQPGTSSGTPAGKGHLVGMGYDENDREAALKAALAETIGLGMIKAGQSVYLRVNSNSGDYYPYSTAPETIIAIGGLLRDLGVTDIRVGDRSFWGDQDTAGNLQANKIAEAAKKIGTTAKVYDADVDWLTLPSSLHPNWTGTVRLPKDVTTADHQIVLSVVKTHFISQFTMSLKIALGLVHEEDRARTGNLKTHDTKVLYKQIAQINKAITPSLVVMDGYEAVISGGPTINDKPSGAPSTWKGGITGKPKVFIVSTDRIAADVAGIAVLQTVSPSYEAVTKTKPFENPQIQAAIAAGELGIDAPSKMDLSGPTVPNLDDLKARIGI